ncbi:lipoprotein [Leptospira ellisii]|nr:lipoprotein [Leptospira ellisii]MDV6234463.1 lipoprotein [Leptospira ellisii]
MFPALFYALFINGCTQSMRLYHDLTYTITLSEVDSSALVSGSQIGIVRFLSKSSNQPDIISSVFSDNLLFFLHKNGLKGTIVNSDLSTKTPDMMQQAGANANASIVSVSQKQNTSYLLSPDQVKEISVATSADYVITGFVHETKAGNFLDPVQSSGIIVYVYSKNGSQVVQMQFIGSSPLELYDNSSEVARVFANRISDLVRSKKR